MEEEKERKVKYEPKVQMHSELTADNTAGNVFLCESI